MTDPNPKCPACEGKGEPNLEWSTKTHAYETTGIKSCRFCFASWDTIYGHAEGILMQYTGKKTAGMQPDQVEDIYMSEDGQLYRRLHKWLWENPPVTGTKNGMAPSSKPSMPFNKLFKFEGRQRPARKLKPLECGSDAIIPWFVAGVPEMRIFWKTIAALIPKKTTIPILGYAKLTTDFDMLFGESTDLDTWAEDSIISFNFNNVSMIVPVRKISQILKECKKTGEIVFGTDPFQENTLIVAHETAVWRIPKMDVESYPSRRLSEEIKKDCTQAA
jgi:hypothetical protein